VKPVKEAALKLPPAYLGQGIHVGIPDRDDDVCHAVESDQFLGLLRGRGARDAERGLETVAFSSQRSQSADSP